MRENLEHIDQKLLLFLNSKHTPFWDSIMIAVTHRLFWIPFYLLIVALIIWHFRKHSIYILLTIGLLVAASDRGSSGLIKPIVKRLRPCHETSIANKVRTINGCGGQYGFVSSHASSTFALAVFIFLLGRYRTKWSYVLFPWAFLVSYSRIYLGVHYPGDIVSGALFGGVLALLFYWLYKKYAPQIERGKIS